MPAYIVTIEPSGSFFIASAWTADANSTPRFPPIGVATADGRTPYEAARDALASAMPDEEA